MATMMLSKSFNLFTNLLIRDDTKAKDEDDTDYDYNDEENHIFIISPPSSSQQQQQQQKQQAEKRLNSKPTPPPTTTSKPTSSSPAPRTTSRGVVKKNKINKNKDNNNNWCFHTSPLTRLLYWMLIMGAFKAAHDFNMARTVLVALKNADPTIGAAVGGGSFSGDDSAKAAASAVLPMRNLGSVTYHREPTYKASHGLDIMQVVRTRFMQRQPKLTALGKSRLELFKAFCLPTMLKQTLQDFAWLVYTDPDLDDDVLNELKELLEPHPNFYLVLSNDNEQSVPQLVEEAVKNPAIVLTGNLEYLTRSIRSHAESQASVVLYIETGLDADDGLQKDTLSEIQKHAVAETYLWNSPTQRSDSYHWFILCVGNHYEWKNLDVFLGKTKDYRGVIVEHHNRRRCVTPGLTMVNSLTAPHDPQASRTSIFDHAPFPYNELVVNHWRLNEKYPNCRVHGANQFEPCWKQINNDDKTHTAIRARTITSTGMKDIQTTDEEQTLSNSLWSALGSEFGIPVGAVKKCTKQIYADRIETVQELMQGRCKKGHSCLDQTEKDLKDLLDQLAH